MAPTFITASNKTPLIQIITWFLLVTSILGVLARGAIKAAIRNSVSLDDYLISGALLSTIGQSVAVSVQTAKGFGKHLVTLNSSSLLTDLKSEYAANLFYIPSLCFSKLSVLAFIARITPAQGDKRLIYGLTVIIILWAVSGEFSAAFQCKLPKPYDYLAEECFNRTAWSTYIESMNITTDMALIMLPFWIIRRVKMSMSKKLSVQFFFTIRLIAIVASISKLVYLKRVLTLPDSFFEYWIVAICTQTIQCLEIIAACVLYLKPLLDSLDSGFIRSGDLLRRGEAGYEHSRSRRRGATLSNQRTLTNDLNNRLRGRSPGLLEGVGPDWDQGSLHSRSPIIIRETRTWTVETSTIDKKADTSEESKNS